MSSFQYTHAIVCRVPHNVSECDNEIDVAEAQKQHENYVKLLRDLDIDVIELPPDESIPRSVYVEDSAVICNGSALITKPIGSSRRREVESIRLVLKKDLKLPVIEISNENAQLDGSDVLFTGKEFFVGISNWTNEAGAKAVAAAFPEYPCTLIKIFGETHLKAHVTIAGPNVLCVSSSNESQRILKQMEREATHSYQLLTVPEQAAANVIYANNTLIHRSVDEIPESYKFSAAPVEALQRDSPMSSGQS